MQCVVVIPATEVCPATVQTWIPGKTDRNAVTTLTTTRSVFERVILGQRTLADAIEHHDITTSGDAKAVSDLWALLVDFKIGFPVVGPAVHRNGR